MNSPYNLLRRSWGRSKILIRRRVCTEKPCLHGEGNSVEREVALTILAVKFQGSSSHVRINVCVTLLRLPAGGLLA